MHVVLSYVSKGLLDERVAFVTNLLGVRVDLLVTNRPVLTLVARSGPHRIMAFSTFRGGKAHGRTGHTMIPHQPTKTTAALGLYLTTC